MNRPMTPDEKVEYQGYFPVLDVDAAVVTGEVDGAYNCVAWTVGISTVPIWPLPATVATYDTFYGRLGYVRASSGEIALMGTSKHEILHGMISGHGHGPRWESKAGSGLRFQHGLNELNSSAYGHVVAKYRKAHPTKGMFAAALELMMKIQPPPVSFLSPDQRVLLTRQIQGVPDELRATFKTAFGNWKASWYRGALSIVSNPAARRVGATFDALIALGPKILPLLIETLADPANHMALQLYDCMQPNPDLLVTYEPDDERILEGEPGRARRTVEAWFANR